MPPTDAELRELLAASRTIAVVGHSDKPHRDSYRIGQYLRGAGYRVYVVNPMLAELEGEPVYPSLRSLPEPIDIVDVFRRAVFLPGIVEDAIAIRARALWAQLGVSHREAEARARAAGLFVVSNRCILVERERLGVTTHG
jgi:predicted CoA-binding protein